MAVEGSEKARRGRERVNRGEKGKRLKIGKAKGKSRWPIGLPFAIA